MINKIFITGCSALYSARCTVLKTQKISAVARLAFALPLNLSKSMANDLKVTLVSPGDIA